MFKEHSLVKGEVGGSSPSPWTIFSHTNLGLPECPYVERYMANFYFFSIRIHHWLASDDIRHFHDHPWWYISWVIKGFYIERSPKGETIRKTNSIAFYKATHQHSVIIKKPCWTLLITGREKRDWGFWVKGRFRKRNKYFYMYGHHPCE